MYNRYIPQDGYVPVESEGSPSQEAAREPHTQKSSILSSLFGKGGMLGGLSSLLGGGDGADKGQTSHSSILSGLLDKLGLGKLDRGDILLLLVLIYLFRETEDDEWLIILALVLLMGL